MNFPPHALPIENQPESLQAVLGADQIASQRLCVRPTAKRTNVNENCAPGRVLRCALRASHSNLSPFGVNLHCCRAMADCESFDLLYPMDAMRFGLKNPLSIG